ncbi:glycosyltransferase family 2 protein [Neobacillus mesonae]|uniref:glycosyltransferase family 2 protein n=1 Tax=Neobacillus mesonae TaxID=1193713 RepID=UPI00203F8CEC|nr:glycosyltransferase family 2 protein [Neobacillus mesonae]MCM3567685.1 glycosyltransferase [Neobacillus mesonae]
MLNLAKIFSNRSAADYHIVNHKTAENQLPKLVSVITPVYNAEKYLRKTINSVLGQTLGMSQIEYILVDDGSTDSSREILLDYTSKFENIMAVFLKKNTGTPGRPRNIGIQLSNAKYISFLDADDWFEPTGLETLTNILEETGDSYVVGKTIQVNAGGNRIIGEHESCKERRSVRPHSIPHIFHHLGPRARMVRAEVIKDHQIVFPEMKFAEDKQFFMEVLLHSPSISTTSKPIYYLNRMNNEKTRLTNQTNILQKTNCNVKVINHVMKRNVDKNIQKMMLNRLYELDSITRLFTTPHFQKTKLKRVYYHKLNQVLKTTKKLDYEFSEEFLQPMNKVVYQLFREKKYRDLEQLYAWNQQEKIKEVFIKDGLPYTAFNNEIQIRVPMHATYTEDYFSQNKYCLQFQVFGDYLESITDVLIRDTKNGLNDVSFPVTVDKSGNGNVEIDLVLLNHLPPSTYSIFLRYHDYMKTNIRTSKEEKVRHLFQNRQFTFYRTVYSNIGLKIESLTTE